MKVEEINHEEDITKEPSVTPDLFKPEKMFHGGMRGKTEHRKHVKTKAIIGRWGSTTYFRGACWNCKTEYIGNRNEKTKSLLKCPNCSKTSTMYKGFFNDRNRHPIEEYETPKPEELAETMYICTYQYGNLPTDLAFLTKEEYEKKENKEKYHNINLIKKIEPE